MIPTRFLTLLLVMTLAPAPAHAQEVVRTADGVFEYLTSPTGVVIAAPHGTYDINTPLIAISTAAQLHAGYIVFRGAAPGLRINVNRPTEGAGRTCANEPLTERARSTYETYVRLVRVAAGTARLPLYVEIHGNAEPRTAPDIEVAAKGMGANDARALKEAYPLLLAAVRRRSPSFPALDLRIEPAEQLFFTATCTKTLGIFSTEMIERALHFELPRAARQEPILDAAAALISGLLRALPGFR